MKTSVVTLVECETVRLSSRRRYLSTSSFVWKVEKCDMARGLARRRGSDQLNNTGWSRLDGQVHGSNHDTWHTLIGTGCRQTCFKIKLCLVCSLLAKKWDAVVPGNSIYFNFIYILKVLLWYSIPVDSTWRGVAWRGVGVGDLPDRYPHRREVY